MSYFRIQEIGRVFLNWRSLAFKLIKRLVSRKFPNVKWLTTQELADWFETTIKPQPIIIDARTQAEYAVSHLKHSQHIDPDTANLKVIADSKNTPIVVYCSVGYRSAKVAECLEQAGFTQVYNLEGSIFQWANEDRAIFNHNCPTKVVHPYNQNWGRLLKLRYRAQVEPVKKQISAS